MFNSKKMQSGFTLVELLIVVGIIAILAAIAYPSYMNFIQRGRMEAARSEIVDNIKLMEEHYAKYRKMCAESDKTTTGACRTLPSAVANANADFYDTRIQPDPFSNNTSSYIIASEPNTKAGYSSNTVEKKQLHLLYYSNGSGYVKCTKTAYDEALKAKAGDSDTAGCTVM